MPAQLQSGEPPPLSAAVAIRAWNLMAGSIDWAALPIICDMLGVSDPELLVSQLVLIRDAQTRE